MTAIEQFYTKTVVLIDLLENKQKLNRDEKIATIEQLIDERDQLMGGITAPFSAEEKELGAKIIQLNEKLASLLAREKVLIQKDMKDLKLKKESTNKYANPYESMSALDGIYYDKRN